MLSNDVYVGTGSRVLDSVLMDKVSIGEGAVVKRAIIDKNVRVPAGAAIGLDHDLDRARGFKVTESGITVLSKGQHVPEPGDAERALSAANLRLVPNAVRAATEDWPELREPVEKAAEVQAAAAVAIAPARDQHLTTHAQHCTESAGPGGLPSRCKISPMSSPDLTPEEIQACLKVLNTIHVYDEEHPDYVSVRRATGKMFKAVKRHRRVTKRDLIAEADRAVIALTATAAPDRIDDETRGQQAGPLGHRRIAGHLIRSRPCYICKKHYTQVDAFYHQLCPECAAFSHGKRDARTDLTGRRALLTGGRAKIGMYIALRLLRDGAHTTITTRFPKDAARRFAAMEDSGDWLHRLRIVGIDLRDPSQVMALTDSLDAAGPLDIIINNAAQTVRRSGNAYKPLVDAEDEPLPAALEAANGGPELRDVRPRTRQAPAGPGQQRHWTIPYWPAMPSLPWRCPPAPHHWNGSRRARPSTPAAWSRTSPPSTAGPRWWTKWIHWKCSRCSCATSRRRSCWSAGCAAAMKRSTATGSTS